MEQDKTSMGMSPNVAGLLSYLLGWITGLVFFFGEKENQFVRFHAMQSIVVFGAITVIYIVFTIFQSILVAIAFGAGATFLLVVTGFIGLLMTLLGIVSLVLWILLMIMAYQNSTFKLPIAGNIAEKYVQ